MNLKNIQHLGSIDLFRVLICSFLALGIPMIIFMLILVLFGVPITINGVDKYGLEAVLYGLLFTPIMMAISTIVFWLYIALGWKMARWFLKQLGKMP